MFSLSGIAGVIAGPIVDKLIGPFLDLGKAYINKQITMEELRAQMVKLLISSFADVEKTHAEELTKSYATFMEAASKNTLLRVMWAAAVGSQIFVLFWSQFVVPLLYAYGYMNKGWHAGTSAEWAYLLVGSLLGLGPMVLRAGPAAPNVSTWKQLLIGK